MPTNDGRLRAILAGLLLVSATLFAIGATVERHQHHVESSSLVEGPTHTEGSEESGAEGSTETHSTETHSTEAGSEKLLGVDPEAPWVVAMAVAISVLLALGLWVLGRRAVVFAVIAFGLVAAALDVRELVHQVHESRALLVAVASVLAVLSCWSRVSAHRSFEP